MTQVDDIQGECIAAIDSADQPAAISAAKAQYTASAHGYEIVGDQGKADKMHEKAASVGSSTATPPPAKSDDTGLKT